MGKKSKTSAWVSSDVARSLVALAIVIVILALKPKESKSSILEQTHVNWLLSHGAIAHVEIGRACKSCPRGLIAKRDLMPAALILRIPNTALIKFPHLGHSAFAAVSVF
jgi:hypothetical protein